MSDVATKQETKKWTHTTPESFGTGRIITRWHLDAPKQSTACEPQSVVEFRGWALALPEKQQHLHVVFRFPGKTLSCPMNAARPDVVKAAFQCDPQGHPQLLCGFNYRFPYADVQFGLTIGFETDLEILPACILGLV